MKQILRFGSGDQLYTFPDTGVAYSDNFRDLVPRTTRLPGLTGGFDELGEEPAPSEIGKVNFSFWLHTELEGRAGRVRMTRLRDAVNEMAAFGWKRLYMQPEDPDADERYCTARINSIQMSERADNRHDLSQRVSVVWQVPDPRWYTQGTEAWSWGDGTLWSGAPWGGSATAQACSGTSTDITITTQGNAITYPRLIISCAAGQSAQNPTVQRLVGSGTVADEISYTGSLSAGDSLTINCRKSSVKLGAANAYDDFSFNYPDWLRLFPGENTLRVTLANSSDACSIRVLYYEAYV